MKHRPVRPAAAAFATAALAAFAIPAQAATFNVNDAAGLISAITTANSNDQADVIDLGGNTITLTAVDNNTSGPTGLPAITADNGNGLTLRNGHITRSSSAAGTPLFRLLLVLPGANAVLEGLTLTGSEGSGSCGSACYGSVIQNAGTLAIDASQITGNSGYLSIVFNNQGQLTIANSTVAQNGVFAAAAIFNRSGALTITNSTVSGNSASNAISALENQAGAVTVVDSTFSGNRNNSGFGGVVHSSDGSLTFRNSLIVNSTAGANCSFSNSRGVANLSFVGSNFSTDGSCVGTGAGAGTAASVDAAAGQLGPLASNGGPTPTHALLAGNPAIDAVAVLDCTSASDQRGLNRPKGSGCDAGAYEAGSNAIDLAIVKSGPASATVGDTVHYSLVVTNAGPDAASGVDVADSLPAGLSYVSANTTQGSCSYDAPTVSCALGALPAGGIVEVAIAATAAQVGLLTNTASVIAAEPQLDVDGNPANDSASASTQVNAAGPTLAARVQQPIDADGGSVFNAKKGVIPVKFTLTADGSPTCSLPAATIAISRLGGATAQPIDESVFSGSADAGNSFRISDCQYLYNVNAKAFGAGQYQVDILIGGDVVGSAHFALK